MSIMKMHKFGKCFKANRDNMGKGTAWKHCQHLAKGLSKIKHGEKLANGKPQHDMYDLTPEALRKIDKLVPQK